MKYTEINYNFVLGYYVVPEPKKEIKTAIDNIKEIIQDESGIDNFLKNSRKRSYVDARRIFYHILRNYHCLSFEKIGKICGKRNHATILHSLRDVEFLIKSDPDISSLYNRVSDRVLNLKTEKQLLLEKIERLEKELLTLKKEKNGIYI
tara:strand:+ start:348 stop:794 length:447 start_codon:yes stop_codon:yes gene_type:complete